MVVCFEVFLHKVYNFSIINLIQIIFQFAEIIQIVAIEILGGDVIMPEAVGLLVFLVGAENLLFDFSQSRGFGTFFGKISQGRSRSTFLLCSGRN